MIIHKISLSDLYILSTVKKKGFCYVEDLAEVLSTSIETIYVYAYRLRKRGILKSDKFGFGAKAEYRLTDAGIKILDETIESLK